MMKAGINIIAHKPEVGNAPAILGQIGVDGIGIAIIAGNQTERGIGVFVEPRRKAGADPADQAGQILPHPSKQFRMVARAGGVPLREPQVLRIRALVNLAFDQHQVIRLDANPGARQRLHEAGQVAPGVDHPAGAALLQLADALLHGRRNRRAFKLGKERAVEIG